MSTFYVTFGQKYRTEKHPVLGEWPGLPDGWIELEATDIIEARKAVASVLGREWCDVYSAPPGEWFTLGRLGSLDELVAGVAMTPCVDRCGTRTPLIDPTPTRRAAGGLASTGGAVKVERRDSISFVRAAPAHALRRFLAGLPHDAEVSVSVDRPPSPTPTDRGAVTIHAVWTDALAGGDSDE